MLELTLAPKAEEDLTDIFEYTLTNWGLRQAERYQDAIFDAFLALCEHPQLGSIYYFKKGDYRRFRINKHIVFYRVSNTQCMVIRVLHERMDLSRDFL